MKVNKYNVVLILLIVLGYITKEVKSEQSNNNDSDYEDQGKRNISEIKAFKLLKLAPWSSMKEIEMKYKKLSNKYENNMKKMEDINLAYKYFKTQEKNGTFKQSSIIEVIFKGIKDLIVLESFLGLLYLISLISFKIQALNKFFFYQICSFNIVERFFPHWFRHALTQYITAFILGTIVYMRKYIISKIFGKNIYKENTSQPQNKS